MNFFYFILFITFQLIFAFEKPSINWISEDQYTQTGDSVEFTCIASKNYDQSISWLKKGNSSESVDDLIISVQNEILQQKDLLKNSKYQISMQKEFVQGKYQTTYSLTINKIEVKDAGVYVCKIISFEDEDAKDETNLIVLEPAKSVIKNGSKVEAFEGEHVILECVGDGNPLPIVSWNSKKLIDEQWINKTLDGSWGGRHVISSISKQEAGTYFCKAENNFSNSIASIEVAVKFSPLVKAVWPVRRKGSFTKVEFACQISGYPEPTVTWFKDGYSVMRTATYNITTVYTNDQVLTSILQVDITFAAAPFYGNYRCRVINELGEAEARMKFVE